MLERWLLLWCNACNNNNFAFSKWPITAANTHTYITNKWWRFWRNFNNSLLVKMLVFEQKSCHFHTWWLHVCNIRLSIMCFEWLNCREFIKKNNKSDPIETRRKWPSSSTYALWTMNMIRIISRHSVMNEVIFRASHSVANIFKINVDNIS